MSTPIVEVVELRKSFERAEVLRGVSFRLDKGETLVVMGGSGSGRTVLFDLPKNATTYSMNVYTQFPWSNVSRDGSMYTLQTTNQNNLLQTSVFGSLKGGNPIQFAYTSRGSVDIAGWTTWR